MNTLFTMISNDERISVFNLSGPMFPSIIETDVKGLCNDKIALDYATTLRETKLLYECSKMSIYGTDYKRLSSINDTHYKGNLLYQISSQLWLLAILEGL